MLGQRYNKDFLPCCVFWGDTLSQLLPTAAYCWETWSLHGQCMVTEIYCTCTYHNIIIRVWPLKGQGTDSGKQNLKELVAGAVRDNWLFQPLVQSLLHTQAPEVRRYLLCMDYNYGSCWKKRPGSFFLSWTCCSLLVVGSLLAFGISPLHHAALRPFHTKSVFWFRGGTTLSCQQHLKGQEIKPYFKSFNPKNSLHLKVPFCGKIHKFKFKVGIMWDL